VLSKTVIAFLLVSLGLSVSVNASVAECDLLAAHPDDPQRTAPGVESGQLALQEAEAACRIALSEFPNHARINFQLGRVLYYQGRIDESTRYMKRAAESGYPEAIFVLGYLEATSEKAPNPCVAGEYWLRSLALDHPWSAYYLVQLALDGRFEQCAFKLSSAQLAQFAELAEDHITVGASKGRVEAMAARLEEARKQ
jgi:tetratricopeptide (TPR) repeat protein